MTVIKRADMHLHSTFSADADDELAALCQQAVERGLSVICFTEHLDCNPVDKSCGYYNEKAFFQAVEEARERYQDRLLILRGIEFSEPQLYSAELAALSESDYDVILGSIHFIADLFVGNRQILQNYSPAELSEDYYQLVYEMVQHGGFDVLAHLDFPKRYYDSFAESPLITAILEEVIRQEMALEINTSTLRKGFAEAMPGEEILKTYREMGGRRVTVGSDAHRKAEVGADFAYAYRLVQELGLIPGYYRRRKFVELC